MPNSFCGDDCEEEHKPSEQKLPFCSQNLRKIKRVQQFGKKKNWRKKLGLKLWIEKFRFPNWIKTNFPTRKKRENFDM